MDVPIQRVSKTPQKGMAHVVYFIWVGVDAGEDDVPEEPAADGEEDCDGVCEGFGVCFDESLT